MAGEKNFENRLKKWLESEGIYPLGEPVDRMSAPPCGFYEKRWGGSRYVKSGLPDMRITVKGMTLEKLKAMNPLDRYNYSVNHPDEYKELYGGNE